MSKRHNIFVSTIYGHPHHIDVVSEIDGNGELHPPSLVTSAHAVPCGRSEVQKAGGECINGDRTFSNLMLSYSRSFNFGEWSFRRIRFQRSSAPSSVSSVALAMCTKPMWQRCRRRPPPESQSCDVDSIPHGLVTCGFDSTRIGNLWNPTFPLCAQRVAFGGGDHHQ